MSVAPRVAVVMPTYGQAAFIERALESLCAQREARWQLLVVDDASRDDTVERVERWLDDPRIRLIRLPANAGVGAALNTGLASTTAPVVAYLPSDDTWYPEHLEALLATLDEHPDAAVAYAGLRHHYNRYAPEPLPEEGLQLVQIAHRRVGGFRWLERQELIKEDLGRMGVDRLLDAGRLVETGRVTCELVSHPGQLRKLVREPNGGLNAMRRAFALQPPIRIPTTVGERIDEVERYAPARDRPDSPPAVDGLRILLAGELAYNADRVLALEERGHRLFGTWMSDPYWYNTVGPLPFGHVTDASCDDPEAAIRETRPDVIYALLNWQAVPFAASVMRAARRLGVPFVWHFKEGPFISLEHGQWDDLVELPRDADGLIHSSDAMRAWFGTVVPGAADPERTFVLDGDLPKADWFDHPLPARPEWPDGGIHTVVPGRPIGLHPPDIATLAKHDIHVHFYGDFTHGQWRGWIETAGSMAPRHLHLHGTVGPERWVEELGRYDAGGLHVFESRNGGDIRRPDWDDLNIPARLTTLAAAGLPVLQRRNPGAIVATQQLTDRLGIGITFRDWDDLAKRLREETEMSRVRGAMAAHRNEFTFDHHADDLIAFFRTTIERRASRAVPGTAASGPTVASGATPASRLDP